MVKAFTVPWCAKPINTRSRIVLHQIYSKVGTSESEANLEPLLLKKANDYCRSALELALKGLTDQICRIEAYVFP